MNRLGKLTRFTFAFDYATAGLRDLSLSLCSSFFFFFLFARRSTDVNPDRFRIAGIRAASLNSNAKEGKRNTYV